MKKWGVKPGKRSVIHGMKQGKRAAEYDDRLSSREGAAESLGMSVSALADAELGLTKCMPVDKAVLMADRYNASSAPELLLSA